jgi:cell wall-associated NlpC family hydrolase
MRFKLLVILLAITTVVLSGQARAFDGDNYQSPYQMVFSYPIDELLAPDQYPPRNNRHLESTTPHGQWYSRRIKSKYGAWGPEPRHYPALANNERIPADWKRQRVLAVGYKMIGLPYQHHHIPDWDPPPSWPWKKVAYGRNSKGVDCSDFTSWMYNYGLGIKFSSAIKKQAQTTQISGPGGQGTVEVRVIRDNGDYDELVHKLKAGDLLYICNNKGILAHVIMWVGEYGRSPDGAPLIIDSTGTGHKDSNGVDIPIGIHLRPFLKDSWYYKSFAHAHRIIREK